MLDDETYQRSDCWPVELECGLCGHQVTRSLSLTERVSAKEMAAILRHSRVEFLEGLPPCPKCDAKALRFFR